VLSGAQCPLRWLLPVLTRHLLEEALRPRLEFLRRQVFLVGGDAPVEAEGIGEAARATRLLSLEHQEECL
jgi:hypothetical protein